MILIGAGLLILWGIAQLFPTKGFGEITGDNKYVIAMEWIVEGVALIFIGLLVLSVAIHDQGRRTAPIVS